jgi:hypothetical protein
MGWRTSESFTSNKSIFTTGTENTEEIGTGYRAEGEPHHLLVRYNLFPVG